MSRGIKMIGLDLDGTLLTDKKELTDYTKEVLTKAIGQGVTVLIATGRPISAIPEELISFPGMRYIVTSNGARVLDLAENRVLIEHTMSQETAGVLLDILKDYDAIREAFVEGMSYCAKEAMDHVYDFFEKPYMGDYILNTRIPAESVKEQVFLLGKRVDKVHGIFKDLTERKEALERMRNVPGIIITGAFGNSLEINSEGTSKAESLISLGKLLGIKREEIMTCGDGMNDYEMIEKAGFGVAMENGNPKVKAVADYVTVSNEEDGVAKAIEKFVLR